MMVKTGTCGNQSLDVKAVSFMGAELMAARDADGQIWVGVSYVCKGIGLSKNEKDRQVKNVQSDRVLSKGCVKFDAGVFDPNNTTVALQLDFVPLWLAKISITPAMERETPELAYRLEQYQLKAKDVLAAAFLPKQALPFEDMIPKDYPSALRALADSVEREAKLEAKIEEDRPKVQFANTVAETKGTLTVEKYAKAIYDAHNLRVGRNRLFKILRSLGYLQSNNMPYQRYIESGYFDTCEVVRNGRPYVVPLVTGKGQTALLEKIIGAMNVM